MRGQKVFFSWFRLIEEDLLCKLGVTYNVKFGFSGPDGREVEYVTFSYQVGGKGTVPGYRSSHAEPPKIA
jgi:hypothetical protein